MLGKLGWNTGNGIAILQHRDAGADKLYNVSLHNALLGYVEFV